MDPLPLNHFSSTTAAKRYARGRPFFHPIVREAILRKWANRPRPERALDVACGTGLSTRILVDITATVIAIDASAEMVAQAPRWPNVEYRVASAEQLPLPSDSFDLITVALAFHWFDRDRFLREAHRVLKPDGKLVIYNHWFSGEMRDNSAFTRWHQSDYLTRYPNPSRDTRPFGAPDASAAGFCHEGEEKFSNHESFTAPELASYLLTQCNVIAAVEAGRESIDDAFAWIVRGATPFFGAEHEVFLFKGTITYLSRDAAATICGGESAPPT